MLNLSNTKKRVFVGLEGRTRNAQARIFPIKKKLHIYSALLPIHRISTE